MPATSAIAPAGASAAPRSSELTGSRAIRSPPSGDRATRATARYAPGAVAVSTDYARAGTRSVRITVHEGDIEQTGDDGKQTERAELDSGKHAFVGRDVWYGFSFLIPPGFPVVDNRLVIAQWKQYGLTGSPLVAERYRNGKHDLTIRVPDSGWVSRKHHALPEIAFGRWNDMVYHIRFSRGEDGLVEVWMNGSRVVTYKGATAFKEGEDNIYNKFGLYRDRWKDPMTIYFDNYTLADSFAAVDPAIRSAAAGRDEAWVVGLVRDEPRPLIG